MLFTFYAIGLAYLFDGSPLYLGMLGALLALAIAARYLERGVLSVIAIIASSMVLAQVIGSGNIYDIESLATLLAIAVPMLLSLDRSIKRAKGRALPKIARGNGRGLIAPLLYIGLMCASMMLITQSRIYETYFIGGGNPMMQVLLFTALAGIFFIPLYERCPL